MHTSPRSIAVVGAGVSGLTAARELSRNHDVTMFEAGDHIGGHARTLDVELDGRRHAVDAGFVVFNGATYPRFSRLLDELGVASRETDMSFSVRCEATGLEYCGSSLNGLFAQRRNLIRPAFYALVADILRFNREGRRLVRSGAELPTLRELLRRGGYGGWFVERYIVPMGGAIWSAGPDDILDFPADFFLRFFDNHGLLSVDGHHRWRVVEGGSRNYVEALVRPFRRQVHLNTPVQAVRRAGGAVELRVEGAWRRFDEAVLATHADVSLDLLRDPSPQEREVLGAFRYSRNEALLHTDAGTLPRRRAARASWNALVPRERPAETLVTYDMSRLQGLATTTPLCITLNRSDAVDSSKVLRRLSFSHPLFTAESMRAQQRHGEISGTDRVHYCGAYWFHGFHEDGVRSGLRVGAALGERRVAA